jgi:rubrerythrin
MATEQSQKPPDAPHNNPRLELRCLGCGYGAVSAELIRCPMCGDEAWDFAEWRPFSH